jgi:intracellular multiplication protein IcmJ
MDLLKIVLSVKRGKWRNKTGVEPSDKDFQDIKSAVKKRDKNTCQFCGARSDRNEVHHIDDNHENNVSRNLVTACQLCHAAHHIGFLGNAGKMAYSPLSNLSQADFNQLFIALGTALEAGDVWAERARLIMKDMGINSEIYASRWGGSSPRALGEALLSLEQVTYDQRAKPLHNVNVFFNEPASRAAASKMAKSFTELPVRDWSEIYKECLHNKTNNNYDQEIDQESINNFNKMTGIEQ